MSADACGCNDFPMINFPDNPREAIEVVGEGEIVVTPSNGPNGKKVFTVKRVVYTPPRIQATDNPVREVGQVIDFTWNVTIQQGRNPITSRGLTPQTDPVTDLAAPFSLSVEDVTRSTRGTSQQYKVTTSDGTTDVERNLAISFFNKVYRGYSWKDGVTSGQTLQGSDIAGFTATLANGIKDVYGGVKSYVLPVSAVAQHIYWLYEAGTTPIGALELSNLPFPVVFIPGTIGIVNPHNASITTQYSIVRSANKYASQTLSIDMK